MSTVWALNITANDLDPWSNLVNWNNGEGEVKGEDDNEEEYMKQ